MFRSISVLLCLAIFLSSCATPNSGSVTNVAVPVKCKASEVQKPQMYPFTNSAKTDMDIYEKVKLLLAEINIRAAYELQLEQLKKACTE